MFKFGRQNKNQILQFWATKLNYSQCSKTKTVELPVGKVKGKWQKGLCGYDYYSFEGIPFGRPPVGELRFRPSQPAESWMGKELNCMQERARPVQFDRDTGDVFGNEDCLHLNVYTKHFDSSEPPLPVLVYIHGGGFRTGGATRKKYGPDYLLREDIVFVVFSYRLCALGFLSISSSDVGVSGNAGLHDQLLALRWVKKNICHFNGDVENITIMGTSAGAGSVHYMMCLPETCGLFHKAIMMSGSMLSPWTNVPNTSALFCRLALDKGYLGVFTETKILKFLRSLPAGQLVDHHLFDTQERCFGHLYPFVPRIENGDCESNALVKHPPLKMMREAWSKQVPLLIGGDSFEGLVMYPYMKMSNGLMLDLFIQDPAMILPYELYQCLTKKERLARAAELIQFHYGPRPISKNNVIQTLDHFSYKLFWHGIHRVIISRLAFAQAATYQYRFDFDSSETNLMRINLCGADIRRGVCHADELSYMFPRQAPRPLNLAEKSTIHRMVAILTSFARTGNPNCIETEPEVWLPVDHKNPFRTMNIGRNLEVQTLEEREGIKRWNKIYNDDKCLLYGI